MPRPEALAKLLESVVSSLFKSQAKAFKFASKRVFAASAALALTFTGVAAISAAPAQAANTDTKYNIRVVRAVDNGQSAVIRPGETVTLYVAAYLDTRFNDSTLVSDLVADDTLTFTPNLTSSLTPENGQFNWYITGDQSCYDVTMPQTQQLTWTDAMKNCGGGNGAKYINPYWSARLTNNTAQDATFSVAPTLAIPGAESGLAADTPGFRLNTQATLEGVEAASYTATDSDTSVTFDSIGGLCVARDFAAGSAFKASVEITADGQSVSTQNDLTNTYANKNLYVRHLPVGATYESQTLPGVARVIGYSISSGRVTLTTDGPHNFNGVSGGIDGTGVAEIDAIDSSYAYSPSATTITFTQSISLDDTPYTEVTGATVTGSEGGQYNLMPVETQGVRVSAYVNVYRPVAGSVYSAALSIVDNADGTTSVSRDCGPAAPTFTVDTASSTYNSVALAVDQAEGATSYSCRAYSTGGQLIYSGYLSEVSRAAGQKCFVYALSSSTTYNFKVVATSSFEGEGPESATVSHTTVAGGGGGYTPPVMVTPEMAAPSGATKIKVTTPTIKAMNSAITVTDSSRAYAGANGDAFYGTTVDGTLTVVNNTPMGANNKFAGSGKLVIPGATSLTSVGWLGTKGTGFTVLYRNTAMNTVAKWGALNSATGMKTQEVTPVQIAAFCAASAGSAYTAGNLILTSSAMSAPFVRVECVNMTDPNTPARIVFANIVVSGSKPLVKTAAQITNYTSLSNPCLAVSISSNRSATSGSAALLAVATTYAKTTFGSNSYCQFGSGSVAKREIISISGSGKKLASSVPSTSVIPADITGFSAAPGKSANTWVVLTSSAGGMMPAPSMKFIMTVDAKGKAVKGKNITYSSASAASNAKFANFSTIAPVGQLSSGTITGLRSGSVAGPSNQSWAAVSISLSTGVVTTGQAITITASSYTGTQPAARNMNITAATSDSKKVSVYVLADAVTKQYKAATWTLPTK